MKTTTKAVLAGGAGIALLAGGSTFALWNDTETVDAGEVTSGQMTLGLSGIAAWADVSPDAVTTTWNPATDLLVPGDTIAWTQDVLITATGKNLVAELSVDEATITGDAALLAALDISVSVTDAAGDAFDASVITPAMLAAEPGPYTVTVTVAFPAATGGTTAQNEGIDLSTLGLELAQTRVL